MAGSPGAPAADEPLGRQGEAEWARLEAQLDLASGFWLGFVFSPSPRAARILRARVERVLEADEKTVRVVVLDAPSDVPQLLSMLDAGDVERAGCTWIEGLHVDAPGSREAGWTQAWDNLFLRLNERRNALRQRICGGLVFVLSPAIKPRIRDAAPDLWHVRSLVLELDAVPTALAGGGPKPVPMVRQGSVDQRNFAPDPNFAVAEAQRRETVGRVLGPPSESSDTMAPPRVSRGLALLQAADGFLAGGQSHEALDAASRARRLLRGHDRLGETRALALLALAEVAQGDKQAAALHIERALARRDLHAPDEVPEDWYELAGALALERGDLDKAAAMAAAAEASARRRVRENKSSNTLQALASALGRVGEVRRARGDPEGASAAFEEALLASRSATSLDESPDALEALSSTLSRLGDVRRDAGDLVGAAALYEEALDVDRHLCSLGEATPERLRQLSITLNRIGGLRRAAGALGAASSAFDEALALRRIVHEQVGDTPQAMRDLSSSLNKLGEIQLEAADVAGARNAFEEAVALDRRVCLLLGGDPRPLHDLVVSLAGLATVHRRAGDLRSAATALEECVETARRCVATSPGPERDHTVLTAALRSLADVKRAQGDEDGARAAEQEAAALEAGP